MNCLGHRGFSLRAIALAAFALLSFVALGTAGRAQDTWSITPQDVTRENLWGVTYGAGTLVAAGEHGTILTYSYTDKAWTQRSSGHSSWLLSAGFGAARFVVVGDQGTILVSDDNGATWAPRPSGITNRLNAVTYGGGRWLAVGEQGTVLVSSDNGDTWSPRPALTGGFLRGLAYGQGAFYIGGSAGLLVRTTDTTTFTPITTPRPTSDIEAIAVSADHMWISGSAGLITSSLTGGGWSAVPTTFANDFRALAFRDNGEAVAAGEGEAAIYLEGTWRPLAALPAIATSAVRGENEIVAVGFNGVVARIGVRSLPAYLPVGTYNAIYGSDVVIYAEANYAPAVRYQWYKNVGGTGVAIPGATGLTLILPYVTTADATSYTLQYDQGTGVINSVSTVVRVNPAGLPEVRDPLYGRDTKFAPGVVVEHTDGKMLVAVAYNALAPKAYGLRRFNPDGTLDTTFTNAGSDVLSYTINGLKVDASNRIYVTGSFTTFGGKAVPRIVRLLPNGAIDPTFNPDPSIANNANKIEFGPDGKIYAQFVDFNLRQVRRYNSDGSLDQAFGTIGNFLLVGVDAQSRLVGVQMSATNRTTLIRLLPNGTPDATYQETELFYQANSLYYGTVPMLGELGGLRLTTNGVYFINQNGATYGTLILLGHIFPDGGRDPNYDGIPILPFPPSTSSGTVSYRYSIFYEPDGSLWTVRPDANNPALYQATHYTPDGKVDPSRYATLPNRGFFNISAVARDGSLYVDTSTTYSGPLSRIVPLSGNMGRLTNLSVRAFVSSAAEPLIAGFVTAGEASTRAIVRGIGPTLGQFGVTDAMPDPALTLNRNGASVAFSDDWASVLAPRFTATGAFALPPSSKDAAVEADITSGNYTAVIAPNSAGGTALAELFESADPAPAPRRFVNISARGPVSSTRPLIAGFTITGSVPVTVLVRAVGPALVNFSVPNTLSDPKLTLYRNDTVLWENNDVSDSNSSSASLINAATTKVGAFPFGPGVPKDSAMVVTLPPGNYTAQVSGVNNTAGTALIEVYEVR